MQWWDGLACQYDHFVLQWLTLIHEIHEGGLVFWTLSFRWATTSVYLLLVLCPDKWEDLLNVSLPKPFPVLVLWLLCSSCPIPLGFRGSMILLILLWYHSWFGVGFGNLGWPHFPGVVNIKGFLWQKATDWQSTTDMALIKSFGLVGYWILNCGRRKGCAGVCWDSTYVCELFEMFPPILCRWPVMLDRLSDCWHLLLLQQCFLLLKSSIGRCIELV